MAVKRVNRPVLDSKIFADRGQPESVEPHGGPAHRRNPHHDQEADHRGCHHGDLVQRHSGAARDPLDELAEHPFLGDLFADDRTPQAIEHVELPQKPVDGADHDHSAIDEEAVEQQLAERHLEQDALARMRRLLGGDFAPEDSAAHLVERRRGQHADRRLWFRTRTGFDAHFDHAQQAMKHVLDRIQVLDARIRDVALVPEDEAGADHQLGSFVTHAKRQIPDDRHDRRGDEKQHHPRVDVRTGPPRGDHQADEAGQRKRLEAPPEREQDGDRVEPFLRRHRFPPSAGGVRESGARERGPGRADRRGRGRFRPCRRPACRARACARAAPAKRRCAARASAGC